MKIDRVKLALLAAPEKMRKTIKAFVAKGFHLISIQVFYDTDTEHGFEVKVGFRNPRDAEGEGPIYSVCEDGSVIEE